MIKVKPRRDLVLLNTIFLYSYVLIYCILFILHILFHYHPPLTFGVIKQKHYTVTVCLGFKTANIKNVQSWTLKGIILFHLTLLSIPNAFPVHLHTAIHSCSQSLWWLSGSWVCVGNAHEKGPWEKSLLNTHQGSSWDTIWDYSMLHEVP